MGLRPDRPPASAGRTGAVPSALAGSVRALGYIRWGCVPVAVLTGLFNPDVVWPPGALIAAAVLALAGTVALVGAGWPERTVRRIAVGGLVLDFLVIEAILMVIVDRTVPVPYMGFILVGIEAAYFFQSPGAVAFAMAFIGIGWGPFVERELMGYSLHLAPLVTEAAVVLVASAIVGALSTVSETRRVAAIASAEMAAQQARLATHQAQLNATLALVAKQLLSAVRQDDVLGALDAALASTVLPWRYAVLCRDEEGQYVTSSSSLAREGGRHLGAVRVLEASLTGDGDSPVVRVPLGSLSSAGGGPLDLGTTRGLRAIRGQSNGVLVAVVLVGADDPEALGEHEMAFFEALAYQMSAALDKAALYENVEELALTDALTHLQNRRAFETRLAEEVERSDRYGQPFALLMIDIDHFKMLNDSQGHPAGDRALFRIGELLSSPDLIRRVDQSYRIGGEEFTVILPAITLHDAMRIAERIRNRVGSDDIPEAREQPLGHLTISVGVALHTQGAGTAKDLVVATDLALYEAKHAGRDCVRSVPLSVQTPAADAC